MHCMSHACSELSPILIALALRWREQCVSMVGHTSVYLRSCASCLNMKAWLPLWQGEPASKGTAAPAKKAQEAEHQPPAPAHAPAPSKSRHGRKPQRDPQSANQALQLFSHLQQYRVGVPCSSLWPRICCILNHCRVLRLNF